MDADWNEVSRVAFPPHGGHGVPTLVATMTFDTHQELLWTGNNYGRVSSFYSTDLTRYSSFVCHALKEAGGPVRQILVNDRGVIALSTRTLHMAIRRGLPLWSIEHEAMKDMRCMSFTSKGTSEILVAGLQDKMLVVDLVKGEVTKQVSTEHHYMLMRRGRYICAATPDGTVHLIDPVSYAVVKAWPAHSALINCLDAQGDFVVTCGYSLRHGQTYMLDPFLNIFDIKKMSPMPPIPFPAGAAFVRMHPRMLTTSLVISQTGQIHVVDLMNPNASNVRQANVLTFLNMFEIAPSGEAAVLADGECNIHLWGSPSKIHFVDIPTPVEFAAPEEPHAPVPWSDDIPLNSVGMPYYRDPLFSAWPDFISDVGAPPVKLDPLWLATLSKFESTLYGKPRGGMRRNQVENGRATNKPHSGLQAPKFLSEKARESKTSSGNSDSKEDGVSEALAQLRLSVSEQEVPLMYRPVEIKYSKFGIEDFDFGFYNQTPYSGLETHISNSYANPILQIMHFTPLIRNIALSHAASACISESCLLCELGFLFDMLEKAAGSICQATNMLKALSNHQAAQALGLLEEDPRGLALNLMLQRLTRFLTERIVDDCAVATEPQDLVQDVVSMGMTMNQMCTSCRNDSEKTRTSHVTDLQYPQILSLHNGGRKPKLPTFSQILRSTVEGEVTTKGWCRECRRHMQILTRRKVLSTPSVFLINTAITLDSHKELWSTPGWLPEEIGIILDNNQFFCYEGEDLKLHLQRGVHNIRVYSLVGVAVNIENGESQKPHFVAMINAAHAAPEPPGESQWHLFNDFLVTPVTTNEALSFNSTWKTPSVLAFQIKDANNKLSSDWKARIDTSVLYLGVNANVEKPTFRPLDPDGERPGPDTIVALDAEFVMIRQPEIDVNSDGERAIVRPKVNALARVSVVRASDDESEGTPFIDDYIAVREPVVDFLTSFSGISKDDLDPLTSKHNLVSLKIAYKRLWVLLNLGCKFLGHGLTTDFRVINIKIPREQTIDTAHKFFLPDRLRKLSLAFLAWTVLGEDIQLETHDSIEDARTALKLYRKYQELDAMGAIQSELLHIYAKGQKTAFKPPRKDASGTLAPATLEVPVRLNTPPPAPLLQTDGAADAPTTPNKGASSSTTGGFLGSVNWTPGRVTPGRSSSWR